MPDIILNTHFNNPKYPIAPGFRDDFNAADGVLDLTSDGKPWISMNQGTAGAGPVAWSRAGGKAKVTYPRTRSVVVVDGGASDGVISAYIGTVGNGAAGWVFRAVDAINCYRLLWGTSGSYQLAKMPNSATAILLDGTGPTAANGDFVEIAFIGSNISVKVNTVEVLTATGQTDYLTATYHGLYGSSSGAGTERWESIEFVGS